MFLETFVSSIFYLFSYFTSVLADLRLTVTRFKHVTRESQLELSTVSLFLTLDFTARETGPDLGISN